MDFGKLIEATMAAGPSAGIGLAVGLSVLLGALFSGKIVMFGRFSDMKEQRDKAERRAEKVEQANQALDKENDELRILVAGSLSVARKNASLTSTVMHKRAGEESHVG